MFADGTEIAASMSRQFRERYNLHARLSEIATMQFVCTSGVYPDIVVPQVHTWDVAFANPVGTPCILMDVIRGRQFDALWNDEPDFGATMSEIQQVAVQS